MDPLSIASGAAGLTGVCIKVTKWLYEVIEETRRADTTLSELLSEVNTLTSVLASLDSTIRGCTSQPHVLAYIDSDIWVKIDSQVTECRTTLGLLEMLLGRIHESSRRMFRRGNIQARLVYYANDIKGYKDMVHTHYRAIQMALVTVNVALCVRTSTSQDRMFLELKELRKCVELALNTARAPGLAADPRLVQLAVNLQSMAKSVQSFHTAASTMASSVGGSSRWGGSEVGELPSVKRELISQWQNSMASLQEESSTDTNSDAIWSDQGDNSTILTTPTPLPEEPSADDLELDYDSDLELEIYTNLRQLARESFHKQQYAKSEEFLQKLMSKLSKSKSASTVDGSDMKLIPDLLATCQLAQGRWVACSSVLLSLARDSPMEHKGLPTLLHALAVGFLSENNWTEAQRFCKLALQRWRKVWGKSSVQYTITLALLVRIALARGDTAEALALRRAMPPEYEKMELDGMIMDDAVTGLGFLHSSKEYREIMNYLWGPPASPQSLPPVVEVLPPVRIRTVGHRPEEKKPKDETGKPKSIHVDQKVVSGMGHSSIGNNSPGDASNARASQLLDPYTDMQLFRSRSMTRSPRLSEPLPTFSNYCPNYATLYEQQPINLSSLSFPPRGESETDTFKEWVSDLYLHVQALKKLTMATPSISEEVAVLGHHGKLTCTRDWSILGIETLVSSGGSTYSVHLDIKYDMMSMIVYARFLEQCDLQLRTKIKAGTNNDEGHVVEEVTDDSPENPTDTYKEVYLPSYWHPVNRDSKSRLLYAPDRYCIERQHQLQSQLHGTISRRAPSRAG
ncbi:hypothetical protein V8F20_010128 [Naviculisporaceae sp. PSN 640]